MIRQSNNKFTQRLIIKPFEGTNSIIQFVAKLSLEEVESGGKT